MTPWLEPDWPAPSVIKALVTTRAGGHSRGAFDSFNLGSHVGDDLERVVANRRLLREQANLPGEPVWLNQVHGTTCVDLASIRGDLSPDADAAMTRIPGCVCAILTADCLPILLCDEAGTTVGAAHAGWRGLLAGVIETTVDAMKHPGKDLLAWLGPAIGPKSFEVGDEVREAFIAQDAENRLAFVARAEAPGKWLCDIYALARLRLARLGVRRIYGGHHCTYLEADKFFSYRRERQTGRMASLIWIDSAR